MNEELANVILNEIRSVKDEIREEMSNEIKNLKEEMSNEIRSVKDEIRNVREEMSNEIRNIKDEITVLRNETNERFNVLENELMRNSEQHVMIFEAISELKEKVSNIEQAQECYKKKQEELATEIKAQDELITNCQKRSLVNKFDIENLKEKLAG